MRWIVLCLSIFALLAPEQASAQGFSVGVGGGGGGGRHNKGGGLWLQQERSDPRTDARAGCEQLFGQDQVNACLAAITKDRDNAKLYRWLGDGLLATGRPADAVNAYSEALRIDPKDEKAQRGKDSAQRLYAGGGPQPGQGYAPPPAYMQPPGYYPPQQAYAPAAPAVVAAAPAPAALVVLTREGDYAGTLSPRGEQHAVKAKITGDKIQIIHEKDGQHLLAEGTVDADGKVVLRGMPGSRSIRGANNLEIHGQFVGDALQGNGHVGDRTATLELRRTGAPPATQVAAAPAAPQRPPVAAPNVAADKTAPTIDAPKTLATNDTFVDLNGRVRDTSQIVEFSINGQAAPLNADGSFKLRRGVPVGDSELKLAAVDEWGNQSTAVVKVSRKAPPSAAVAAAVTNTPQQAALTPASERFPGLEFGKYRALVIGNISYKHLPKLETAANDARAVAQVLRENYGFEVDVMIDATRHNILEALVKLRASLSDKDNLLIYYAGHGVVDKYTERGYWLPVDAEDGMPANWLSNTDITDMIKAINAKHIMVVADSCYSGSLVRAAPASIATAPDPVAWIRRALSKRARTVLSSGGLEPVLDGGGGGHSIFAKAFIQALNENRDVLDGQALFDKIKRPVVMNSDQTPEYSDIRQAGHDGGDFVFLRHK